MQSGAIGTSPARRGYPRGAGTISIQETFVFQQILVRRSDVFVVFIRVILLGILLLLVGRFFRFQERIVRNASLFLRQDRPGTQGGSGAMADSLAVFIN